MVNRLRVARLDSSPYRPLSEQGRASVALHQRLHAVIRQHLPGVNASLLAAPLPTGDGPYIEWYSDLAGQPVALSSLAPDEQSAARARLQDRLAALRDLAERLPEVDPDAADLADPLRRALDYPGDASVYVIGGQPVITFWGYAETSGAPPAGPPERAARSVAAGRPGGAETASDTPLPESGRRPGWLWLPALLLLLGLIGAGWWYARGFPWPPWVDYPGMMLVALDEQAALRERMEALEGELRQRLERCALDAALLAAQREEVELLRRVVGLQAQLASQLELCPLRRELARTQAEEQALGERVAGLEARLNQALATCRRKAAQRERQARTAAVAGTAPDKPVKPPPPENRKPPRKGLPPCPGERAPEEAPDVAVVLDSSGSMRFPADMSRHAVAERVLEKVLGLPGGMLSMSRGPTRLQAAQKAVNNVVRGLPDDVDVGLMVLENCPGATNYGFYSGAERGRLYQKVSRLRPMQKTPLADGIARAGNMVDGVRAPAVIVVVSDGEDTCRGNPCAAARALKARKPQLTINVVDIIGDGKSNCIAHATGGKVLTPQSGMTFEQTIKQATREAQKPAHCR